MKVVLLDAPEEMLSDGSQAAETLGVVLRPADGVLHVSRDGGSAEV